LNAEQEFNAGDNAVHHISDANVIHVIGDLYVNLPIILKSEAGWKFGMSSAFHPHHHGRKPLYLSVRNAGRGRRFGGD
jgi:hypothetical protein